MDESRRRSVVGSKNSRPIVYQQPTRWRFTEQAHLCWDSCISISRTEKLLLDQGSSILVPLTILPSPLPLTSPWSETSVSIWFDKAHLLSISLLWLVKICIPRIKSWFLPWCLGSARARELEGALASPIHCIHWAEVHYFIYHVLASHDLVTLTGSPSFVRKGTEVLRGWVALWS